MLINKIAEIKSNVQMTDKNQVCEHIKCQLRTDTILYACKKAKENKKIESDLETRLLYFEQKLGIKTEKGETEYQEYIRNP